jgi:mercuric ion transport protein
MGGTLALSVHMHTSTAASSPRGWKHYLSLGLALLTCPCHLPLLIIALAGTTFGAWLSQYTVVVSLAMIGIFVLALLYGIGFYTTYRRGRHVRIFDKAILWTSTLLVVVLLLGYSLYIEAPVLQMLVLPPLIFALVSKGVNGNALLSEVSMTRDSVGAAQQ